MITPKRLTDLTDSSANPSISIFKGLCLPSKIYYQPWTQNRVSRVLFFGVDLKGNFSLVLDIIIYTISV